MVFPFQLQLVFEGMWGPNRASGTIAIDDVTLYEGECVGK
jgi:MAM domain.